MDKMKNMRVVIILLAMLVLIVGIATRYSGVAAKTDQDKKVSEKTLNDIAENQKKIMQKMAVLEENQKKMMDDLNYIRRTQRP